MRHAPKLEELYLLHGDDFSEDVAQNFLDRAKEIGSPH